MSKIYEGVSTIFSDWVGALNRVGGELHNV